jgi:hypothetical protein
MWIARPPLELKDDEQGDDSDDEKHADVDNAKH